MGVPEEKNSTAIQVALRAIAWMHPIEGEPERRQLLRETAFDAVAALAEDMGHKAFADQMREERWT